MNTKKCILIFVICFILIFFVLSNNVFATLVDTFEGSISSSGQGAEELKTQGGKIVGIIQIVGTIVAVGMLIFLGIKYVLGSADQKAEYRKTMMPYFIGAILIFGFSNITQIIYEWSKNL